MYNSYQDITNSSQYSSPIPIPQKKSSNLDIEYCLKQNLFNPNKCSPPNSWNERLIQRLAVSYEHTHSSILLTK